MSSLNEMSERIIFWAQLESCLYELSFIHLVGGYFRIFAKHSNLTNLLHLLVQSTINYTTKLGY